MSKTKASGSTKLGRDSRSKRLGVKLFDGQICQAGSVIIRQRGTKYLPGRNVVKGGDDTLFALKPGKIKFRTTRKTCFTGKKKRVKVVDVIPL